MPRLQWIGQAARYLRPGDLDLLNAYAEVVESKQGLTPIQLVGTPGLTPFAIAEGLGGIRGMFTASNGRVFVVRGNTLSEILANGSVYVRGALASATGAPPVAFADNRLRMMVADANQGFIYDFGTGIFSRITDPDFPGAVRVDYLDGYFVFVHPNSEQFGWSSILGTDFDALDFAAAEGAPDKLVSQLVIHRELWAFGEVSTEIFVSSGDPDAPFTRLQGTFLEQGCAAFASPAAVGETVCWLSRNTQGSGIVLQASGYQPQRISTHSMEQEISEYAAMNDAVGYAEQWRGHLWYTLHFPTGNATWRFDATTGTWTRLASFDLTTGKLGRHRGGLFTYGFGKHLVGDWENGQVYELRSDAYTDAGQPIRREAILPPVIDSESNARVLHRSLEVILEMGRGADGGVLPASDPHVMLSFSSDNGHSWAAERQMSIGKMGDYLIRAKAFQLGMSRDRRYRLALSDAVPFVLSSALVDLQPTGS